MLILIKEILFSVNEIAVNKVSVKSQLIDDGLYLQFPPFFNESEFGETEKRSKATIYLNFLLQWIFNDYGAFLIIKS